MEPRYEEEMEYLLYRHSKGLAGLCVNGVVSAARQLGGKGCPGPAIELLDSYFAMSRYVGAAFITGVVLVPRSFLLRYAVVAEARGEPRNPKDPKDRRSSSAAARLAAGTVVAGRNGDLEP